MACLQEIYFQHDLSLANFRAVPTSATRAGNVKEGKIAAFGNDVGITDRANKTTIRTTSTLVFFKQSKATGQSCPVTKTDHAEDRGGTR